ncbi:hypothetical protein [Streptomyces roseicoloratus]|uniref:Uncharacterized protein n=1 Tax=Streptomyces roseicoloratus TaxID=2508722 RepID=A0ABY9RPN2_9ACTN|nr:hypothetical protein [Streptomyces roseicoloratus]WMX44155.1 hypothetical protein RGF97_03780 [Streptomyces roseicoloratus]
MQAQLRETATELARLLWREHTVYRERDGGVVIRGEHVRRWISLAPTGGKDQARVRAGRILDGGTTAPARLEAVVDLTSGTAELATVCRRLLAETAADAAPSTAGASRPSRPARATRSPKATKAARPGRGRHTGVGSWVVLMCVGVVVALWAYAVFGGAL